jgi:hypothetical protein
MIAADSIDRQSAKLLTVDASGRVRHLPRTSLQSLFSPGDLIVAQLDGTVGLGHIVIAASGTSFLLISLHSEGAHRDNGRRRKFRVGLDLLRGLIAVEHRKLDVHQDEIGQVGLRFGHPLPPIGSFNHVVARAGQQDAKDTAQVLLVLHDENALAHWSVFRLSARIGSCI